MPEIKKPRGFQPGNTFGGRKSTPWEKRQVDSMRIEVDKWLLLAKKIRQRKALKTEIKAFKLMEKAMLKAMDKLHPNKSDFKIDKDEKVLIKLE